MRCATPLTSYAFTSATGQTRVQVDGFTFSADSPTCSPAQYYVMTYAEMQSASLLPAEVNSKNITYVFSWGLAAVLGLFMLGYAIGVATGVIRKV